ncbi:hypothetical protein V8G54_033368 [Vigna mungo]|uniref:3-dehydrosphinganine reductase n=1 Tax=Vigna mungo TaxID=3915 RepID=A0AAQ3MNQ7_VIGMU
MADAYFFLFFLLPLLLLVVLYFLVKPRPVKIPIKNRHVFITGGSSGIGLALAHRAAAEGARVSILARSLGKLEEARNAIRLATGIEVAVFAADVRDFEAVKRAVDEAGPIDVLLLNHGVFVALELEKMELSEIKFTMDVNLMGTLNLIKAALPAMKNRKDPLPASIALVSSQAGQAGIYGYVAYSASKFGLRGLAEALQQEVIADNIHVSLIFPPDTDTPGLAEEAGVARHGAYREIEEDVEQNAKKRWEILHFFLRKPELTKIIAASSGCMTAEKVAQKALDGIKSGSFIVSCNLEGIALSLATAGLSPQRSFLMAFVEVVAAGILRIVALGMQWTWYGSIEKYHSQRKELESYWTLRSDWLPILTSYPASSLICVGMANGVRLGESILPDWIREVQPGVAETESYAPF